MKKTMIPKKMQMLREMNKTEKKEREMEKEKTYLITKAYILEMRIRNTLTRRMGLTLNSMICAEDLRLSETSGWLRSSINKRVFRR